MPLISSTAQITGGESILFWVLAPLMVLAAVGIALSRKAVHAALCMVAVMLGLAAMYVANDAVFLGVVQIVVYTGAIMMLILFVIMMVGVSASDNYRNTSAYLRIGAWVLALAGGALLIGVLLAQFKPLPVVAPAGPAVSNPVAVAEVLFTQHIFTMELVAALLITAAIGAMTLTHTDRLTPKRGQVNTSHDKMDLYASKGVHVGQLPAPGVYVGGNAPDAPAISGETGKPVLTSVPRVLRVRGLDRTLAEVAPQAVEAIKQERLGNPEKGLHTFAANRAVGQSQAWGMPGEDVEFTLRQPGSREVAHRRADADVPVLDEIPTGEEETK